MVDFMVEFAPAVRDTHRVCQVSIPTWRLYVDGASNAWVFGIRIVLESPGVIRVEHLLRLGFQASNNEVKYETFAVKLRVAVKVGATNIKICSDSYLVVSQVKGDFKA